ncbi:MAG: chorismate mutase [Candidatus Marinimicrobia bacterium]|nr:chorismate mutase [Candidatus Neomarinimicrobiota bacterium]
MTHRISEHRKRIDDLDAKILELIEERIQEAMSIRKLKIDNDIPLFTPEREEELIQRLVVLSAGRIPAVVIQEIWGSIIKGGKQTADSK